MPIDRLFAFASVLAACNALCAQDTETPRAAPVFRDGMAQVVPAFARPADWIRQELWVEGDFDSDGDGKPDRLHVDVTRQAQTDTEGLKVAVIYETSPYFSGTGVTDARFFWDPKHEIGSTPPPRGEMPPIRFRENPRMISNSLVQTWVPRGFAVVHSESPGTGLSQGCPTIGADNESLAPKAVIDWLCGRAKGYTSIDGKEEVKAEWCSGKVGMIGTSYNGTLPLAAATTGVEGLEAIIPVAPNTSYYHYYRSHGLVRHPGGYMGEDVDVLYDFINSGNPARRDWCNEHVRDADLRKNQDRESGDYSKWWAARDYLNDLAPLRAATLMAHAFNDWNVMPEHSVRIYAALKRKGIPCIAYFHQGGHGGDPPFPLVNKWFSRFLYGIENGVENGPKGWVVREGDREPTAYPEYPHPDATLVALHPQSGGAKMGALTPLAAGKQGKETFTDDVAISGTDLAKAEASPHRLLFATAPLTKDLHISGTARLHIRLAANRPAVNLSVWVVSLPWQGGMITDDIITRGWADPQNHASIEKSQPLEPGRFYELEFDLQPDDQVIPAGERIALMVFSSDRDFTLWPKAGSKLTVDLDFTSLKLPVVGGADALKAALGEH
ncbi:MAG: Xaa-Pro dipeptidyl-peptidase [Planctomycetota bacterium]